jgi:hypothetical protein
MASRKDPPVAKAVIREAATALRKRNLVWGFRWYVLPEDGIRMLSVRNITGIPVQLAKPLPGRWSLHFNWLFQPIPPAGEYELLRSSFGLNVSGLVQPPAETPTNFVRYDVDNGRTGPYGQLGRHINVWQPMTVDDNVHYPVPGPAAEGWAVDDVLTFFLSDSLATDLEGRLIA